MPAHRKREGELARPRERKGEQATTAMVTKGELRPVTIPHGDKSWHPIAKRLYDSFRVSGQVDFWQTSDWALAWSICEDLSEYKNNSRRSSQMLAAIMQATERLLTTEADRRKARIELMEPEAEETPAAVLAIADYRKDLGA